VHVFDTVVIGAGQAGLSASYHLTRLGIDHVVLDANDRAGGAWQHRWDSLSMDDVHGVADLPDAPAPGLGRDRANTVIPRWFDGYEHDHGLACSDRSGSTGSRATATCSSSERGRAAG
jgi:cation diffusion facilitator CzcD-associated flavoprotein CzcO